VLDGAAAGTVLVLSTNQIVEFSVDGITVRNGVSSATRGNGGGLFINTAGSFVLQHSALLSNRAQGAAVTSFPSNSGGGLFVTSTAVSVIVRDSRIEGNSASGSGSSSGIGAAGGGAFIELNIVGTSIEFTDNRVVSNAVEGTQTRGGG